MTHLQDEIDFRMVEKYLNRQTTKPGRKVIWNSYIQGTYVKAIHGPIGSKVHKQS